MWKQKNKFKLRAKKKKLKRGEKEIDKRKDNRSGRQEGGVREKEGQ